MQMTPVSIPRGESLSQPADLSAGQVVALITPDGWDGAAPLTFQLSADGVEFYDVSLPDTVELYMIPCAINQWITVAKVVFPQGIWLKIRSGHPNSPVQQEVNRTFRVITV